MKQLLIVNSAKALNAARSGADSVTGFNLSGLDTGAITFFTPGVSTLISAKPTANFGIALGRGANMPALVIPEVDVATLEVEVALPKPGVNFTTTITPGTGNAIAGATYTLVLIKNGTVPNERNTWTVTTTVPAGVTKTKAAVLEELSKQLKAKADAGSLNVTVTLNLTSSTYTSTTITGKNFEQWSVALGDTYGTATKTVSSGSESVTMSEGATLSTTFAQDAIGDKAYIQKLARQCAADKGFTELDVASSDLYPGYPEAVENLTPNASGTGGASTSGYAIFNLRFATSRKSGKTTDEQVWQYVHVAVPVDSGSAYSGVNTILGGF